MKSKLLPLFLVIFALILSSCPSPVDGSNDSSDITNPANVPPRSFWAADFRTDNNYQLEADLLAEGPNCRVWAEKGAGVSQETAITMATVYENEIRPKLLNNFSINGNIYDETGRIIAHNTLELADYIADGDGKLCILLLDIKDDYKPGVSDSYVAGYFWPANLIQNDPTDSLFRYSNGSDMIYIDTYPGRPGSRQSNATFAHELQHLMSFMTVLLTNKQAMIDTWIDEGLSESAAWVYLGEHNQNRLGWFEEDQSGLIRKGNNFFVWDNRGGESNYAVLDDYATVYLFYQWLRLQAGSNDIFKDIVMSDYYDYRAVVNAANRAGIGGGANNWPTLLKSWLAANYINARSGLYGYKNDSVLRNIRAKTMPTGVKSMSLYPGEGVYSITNDFEMPSNTEFINYAGLSIDDSSLSDTATYKGGALLTFNANSNNGGGAASGVTTGTVSSSIAASFEAAGAAEWKLKGPYAIGAGDMLRRNGHGENTGLEFKMPAKGQFNFEN